MPSMVRPSSLRVRDVPSAERVVAVLSKVAPKSLPSTNRLKLLAMDCVSMGVPVIEYWDPNKYSKQQVAEVKGYTTIYRKLGIALAANDEKELEINVLSIIRGDNPDPLAQSTEFFKDLLAKSRRWEDEVSKILLAHDFIEGS